MILLRILLLFGPCLGQTFTVNDLHLRLSSMETKIEHLESEVKMLKSKNDVEEKIELKEVQADISYLMAEQTKLTDRIRTSNCNTMIVLLSLKAYQYRSDHCGAVLLGTP